MNWEWSDSVATGLSIAATIALSLQLTQTLKHRILLGSVYTILYMSICFACLLIGIGSSTLIDAAYRPLIQAWWIELGSSIWIIGCIAALISTAKHEKL